MSMSFSVDLRRFRDKVEGRQGIFLRKLALDIGSSVVLMTPVDTGRARAGWLAGVNTAPTAIGDMATAQEVIERIRQSVGNAKPGDTIFLVNNVHYITILEQGRFADSDGIMRGSPQAPSGMVAETLRRFQHWVDGAASTARRSL